MKHLRTILTLGLLAGLSSNPSALPTAPTAPSATTTGVGEITGGKLDLLVYFSYDELDPTRWEAVFTEYSKLLLDATEGALQLGTVAFTTSADLKAQADVWIDASGDGAMANLSGLGVLGQHMFLSQHHVTTTGAVLGQFGLLHESGHYLWGCLDEYAGVTGNQPSEDVEHHCAADGSGISCPMDGGSAVVGNNQRTEFCTQAGLGFSATEHRFGVDDADGRAIRTRQEYHQGRSCWETIEDSGVGGLSHPADEPTSGALGHVPVLFDYDRLTGDLAVALLIDRSGSMGQFVGGVRRMNLAIDGSQSGIGLMEDGQSLAVVAFDDMVDVVFPLAALDVVKKNQALAAVSNLIPDGATAIGTALLAGVTELEKTQGGNEIIILLTDGRTTAGLPGDDPSVLAALVNAGSVVYSIALGANTNDIELIRVAQATGGRFFKVLDGRELPSVFTEIFTEVTGGLPLEESRTQTVVAGAPVAETFEVSALASAARVSLNYASGRDLGLVLTAPDGSTVPFDTPPAGSVAFETPVSKTLTVEDPLEGIWTATITSPAGAETYDWVAFAESKTLSVVPHLESTALYPAPMTLRLSVVAGVPVGGAQVQAVVTRPDSSQVTVSLFDDGLAAHGDLAADDGVYGALFSQYTGNGSYRFDFEVDASDARVAGHLECGWFGLGEEGQRNGSVEPFGATAFGTQVLSGLSAPAATGSATMAAYGDPEEELTVRESAPTPVAAFALEVSNDEALTLDSLTLDLETLRGDPALLEGMALHFDADEDGRVDYPSVPLAIARVDSDDELSFVQENGSLARLEAGESHGFLLTLGEALPGGAIQQVHSASGPAASETSGLGASLSLGMPGPTRGLALALLLGGLVAWAHRGRARRARSRPPLRWATLALLGCAVVGGACHDRKHGDKRETGGEFVLTLRPTDVRMTGAETGVSVIPTGGEQTFPVRLR